jgi:hypothetical protein
METTMKRAVLIIVATVALTGLSSVGRPVRGPTADPWIGTWKLNLATSHFDPGPPPQAITLTIELTRDGAQKHMFDGVNSRGEKIHDERITNFDRVDVRVSGDPTANLTNAFSRLGPRSFEALDRVDGKVRSTHVIVISDDDQTFTETSTGLNSRGQPMNSTLVYDRQIAPVQSQERKTTMSQRGRILGIGGIFFKSANQQQMQEWYAKHLGPADSGHGVMLPWRENYNP